MKDFKGNILEIGDIVAMSDGSMTLIEAKVHSFTKLEDACYVTTKYSLKPTLKWPQYLIKI